MKGNRGRKEWWWGEKRVVIRKKKIEKRRGRYPLTDFISKLFHEVGNHLITPFKKHYDNAQLTNEGSCGETWSRMSWRIWHIEAVFKSRFLGYIPLIQYLDYTHTCLQINEVGYAHLIIFTETTDLEQFTICEQKRKTARKCNHFADF